MRYTKVTVFGISAVTAAVGCATTSVDEGTAPTVVTDTQEEDQLLTSVNADGTWTANSYPPEISAYPYNLRATTVFTGPAGKTRRMGPCLLRLHQSGGGSGTNCTTVADCSNSPTTLPQGGFRYCAAPNGTGQKQCYYRPGPPTTYCAGTPALQGAQVAPGTYSTPWIANTPIGSTWITYGCFEGCTATDPSSSSQNVQYQSPVCGNAVCEPGEDIFTCADDCNVCGDGTCTILEGPSSCPEDCGSY